MRHAIRRAAAPCALLGLAVLYAAPVTAAEHEHREHGAHEHGHGTLGIALEGSELALELRMPAINVVGFEHEPSTAAQRQAVETALETFGDARALFVPSAAADCKVESSEVELAGLEHDHEEDHEHAHHDEHDEGKEHHEGKHHEGEHHEGEGHHEGEHHAGEADGEEHSELHALYRFHCEQPARLERLQVRVFDALRDVEEIEVQLVTPTRQAALELRPTDSVIELAR